MKPLLQSIPTYLETERLVLRPYHGGDGARYYEMSQRNKTHLAIYESGNAVMRIMSEADAENTIQQFEESWNTLAAFFLGAFIKDTQEFVAQLYIGVVSWNLPEFEIGYFVDSDHEGKGYVTEATIGAMHFAFDHLGAHRVRLECDDTNVRSLRVAGRCGFVKEGHIRENRRNADGTISGTLHYGLLRSEFILLMHKYG